MHFPICGPGYAGRSLNLDAQRLVNLYPEVSQKDAKDVIALVGTPGTVLWAQVGDYPVRGMHVFNGLLYVVAGNRLYSVDEGGDVSAPLGAVSPGTVTTGSVAMADNGLASAGVGGDQLIVAACGRGYVYDVKTGALTEISGVSPGSLTYMDGYFVAGVSGSMSVSCSDLYDGTTWNALATSPVSAAPDLVQGVFNLQQQLWIVKEYTTEVWYDAGIPTSQGFPFQRLSGAALDYGTSAPWSCARGANSLFFLASQRQGDAGELMGVVQIVGQSLIPQLVTPPPVVYRWNRYATVADAFGYCYADGGHTFYVLTFPSANATWVYDASTKLWHERSSYSGCGDTPLASGSSEGCPRSNFSAYATGRHVSSCYAWFAGKHLVGDWQTGNIYEMRSDAYTDDGNPLVAMRTCQHMADKQNLQNIFIHRLQVDMETGVGDEGWSGQTGIDPQAALSWSDDGGHTWSSDYTASMGAAGRYKARAVWRRLGYARDRVFRLAISDPVKRVILGGYVE